MHFKIIAILPAAGLATVLALTGCGKPASAGQAAPAVAVAAPAIAAPVASAPTTADEAMGILRAGGYAYAEGLTGDCLASLRDDSDASTFITDVFAGVGPRGVRLVMVMTTEGRWLAHPVLTALIRHEQGLPTGVTVRFQGDYLIVDTSTSAIVRAGTAQQQ